MDVLYVAISLGDSSRYVLLNPRTVVYKHGSHGPCMISFAKAGATANTAPHRLVTPAAVSPAC